MESLTPELLEVCQLLASGLTYSQIAQSMKIPRSTIGRWARKPAVQNQVEILRNEAMQACQEVTREAATITAKDVQSRFQQSLKRQEGLMLEGYEIARETFALVRKLTKMADEIFSANRPIESHEKTLIASIPAYLRAAGDLSSRVSDCEDKIYAIEDISRRLDEWEEYIRNQHQNN